MPQMSSPGTGLPPKVGDKVNTSFGPGKIKDYREEDAMYVVALRWHLAEGNRAYAYLHAESFAKDVSVYAPGTIVDTPQGRGTVLSYRVKDGFYVVEFDNWLTEGQTAKGFLNPSCVKHHLRARKGQFVSTVYGTGVMAGVRKDGVHVVKIKQLEGGATAYLQADAVQGVIKAYISANVQTPFGQGVVVGYRPEDDIYSVQLDYAIAHVNGESLEFIGAPRASVVEPPTPSAGSPPTPGRDRQASCTVS